MSRLLFSKFIAFLLFSFPCTNSFPEEETFLLINGITDEVVIAMGPHIEDRVTPCSTFKIALSLMGYDAKILQNTKTPTWEYQEDYDDYLEQWKAPQNPQSWINYSCVWYAKLLALQLGPEKIQSYLSSFEYGNQDISGGLAKPGPINPAWIGSSLKISPKEQVFFIQKLVKKTLPLLDNSIQMTKTLLYKEEFPEGWKLFGKTGFGSIQELEDNTLKIRWFVGWIEKDHHFFPFAYNLRSKEIDCNLTIPRVKQLITSSKILYHITPSSK